MRKVIVIADVYEPKIEGFQKVGLRFGSRNSYMWIDKTELVGYEAQAAMDTPDYVEKGI